MASMLRWLDGATLGKVSKRLSGTSDQVMEAEKKNMRTNASENLKITGRMVVPG